MPFRFDVRIEAVEQPDGWWGQAFLFQKDPTEPPLLVGPHDSEEKARKDARELADTIVKANTEP